VVTVVNSCDINYLAKPAFLCVHINVSRDRTAVNRNLTAKPGSICWEFKSTFVSVVQVADIVQQPRGTPNYRRMERSYRIKRSYSDSRTKTVLYIKLQLVMCSENISNLL
jgi:hypothetical protein